MSPSPEAVADKHHGVRYVLAVAGATLVAYLFGHTPWLYPFRLLVTLFHEFGHAMATYLMLGHVERIAIDSAGAGVTYSYGVHFGALGEFVVASGGYLGSVVTGVLLIDLNSRPKLRRYLLPAMTLWLACVAIFFFGGLFTLFACTGMGLALYGAQRYLPAWVSQFLVTFIGVFSATYALQDILELITYRGPWHFVGGVGLTDAQVLAKLTWIPAVVWAGLWLLMGVVLLAWVFRAIVHRASKAAGLSSPLAGD